MAKCFEDKEISISDMIISAYKIHENEERILELITQSDMDFYDKDRASKTIFILAAANVHLEVINYILIKTTFDINVFSGYTFLSNHLIIKCDKKIAHRLIESPKLEIHEHLLSPGIWDETKMDIFEKLIYHPNMDINTFKNKAGENLLNAFAYVGDTEYIKILLNHPNIDVNLPSLNGSTPLINAVYFGCKDTVKLFLNDHNHKFNMNIRILGMPLLEYAKTNNENGKRGRDYKEIAELLEEYENNKN